MIVLDACAAVDMVRETVEGAALSMLLVGGEKIASPSIMPFEVCNAFWKYAHAGLLAKDQVARCASKAMDMVDEYCDDRDVLKEALSEAVRLGHPVYDMLYFVLARRLGATLFTLDRKLQGLCVENGVNCVFTDNEF